MKCEIAHEQIVTAAYGELADEQIKELELHLSECPECGKEREQLLALKAMAEAHPAVEPDANLMARSRLRLGEALDTLPPLRGYELLGHHLRNLNATLDAMLPRHWHERLDQHLRSNVAGLRSAPVAAGLLLAVGVCAGLLGGNELAANRARHAAMQTARAQAQPETKAGAATLPEISNISSIVRDPNSHMVEVRYNEMVPQRIEGSLDDPAIRQLLMLASEDTASTGVRGDSVGLLAAECKAGHGCQKSAGIRDALMVALRYDENEGVREKALLGLEPYVAEDVQVRDAVLEALLSDSDPRIRTAAISILAPVDADTSVRQVLYSVSNTDSNPHIRNASRQVLNSVPEIQ